MQAADAYRYTARCMLHTWAARQLVAFFGTSAPRDTMHTNSVVCPGSSRRLRRNCWISFFMIHNILYVACACDTRNVETISDTIPANAGIRSLLAASQCSAMQTICVDVRRASSLATKFSNSNDFVRLQRRRRISLQVKNTMVFCAVWYVEYGDVTTVSHHSTSTPVRHRFDDLLGAGTRGYADSW